MTTTITPAHVYSRVQLVLAELELIRQEMGRPKDDRPTYKITGAAPREVFFEAQALFRKSDRFCFERTGEENVLPYPPPVDEIQPMHVHAVVDAALYHLQHVKNQLRIPETAQQPAVDPSKQPSDCLGAILLANRQLNRLLEQPFSPSDVYQLLTLGAGYVARLAAHAGVAFPEQPPLQRRQRPGDVLQRIWASVGAVREIAGAAGLTMLDPGALPYDADAVLPSDCYDAASILISELVYLHSRVPGLPPPAAAEMYEVGHKIPSHCHQRASHIEAGLRAVAGAVAKNPDLLRR